MSPPFPWQAPQWERLWHARHTDHMPHALLLTGHRGRGVTEFARRLAAALLCTSPLPDGAPCGRCRSCALHDAGNHPELLVVAPEAVGKAIKVDQIRELMDFVSLKPVFGAFKVALVDPAEAMNRQSANALLKTLEEPPPRTVLALCAERRASLPLTVQSRCQRVDFPPVAPELAGAWLRARLPDAPNLGSLLLLYDHAPLAVLSAHASGDLGLRDDLIGDLERLALGQADPIEVAARWSTLDTPAVFLWFVKLVGDLIVVRSGASTGRASNSDRAQRLTDLAHPRRLIQLFACYDQLLRDRQYLQVAGGVPAINFLEAFAITWALSEGSVIETASRP
ncbi:MAG: DNA polymerase III subunit delta' [Gammaproteobacteria bacterium]